MLEGIKGASDQIKVYDKITLLFAANSGKLKHGEIPRIVKKYNAAGSTFITRMVVGHLKDAKGSYVKTIPIKDGICGDADSKLSLFMSQTYKTNSYNNNNKHDMFHRFYVIFKKSHSTNTTKENFLPKNIHTQQSIV